MNARLMILLTVLVLNTATAVAADEISEQEASLLALVLRQVYTDGGYTVVTPEAALSHMDTGSQEEIAQYKQYLEEEFRLNGVEVGPLVGRLLERNKTTVPLTIPSNQEQGYLVDYDGKFSNYFEEDGGGWEKWYEENPLAHGSTTISVPVYDEDSGHIMFYMGTQSHWMLGSGWIILLSYIDGKLTEVTRVMIWIS